MKTTALDIAVAVQLQNCTVEQAAELIERYAQIAANDALIAAERATLDRIAKETANV